MAEHKSLAEALAAFQGECPTLGKDGDNPHFKSKFTPLDTLVEAIRGPLSQHGLAWAALPGYDENTGAPVLEYRLLHAGSGESLVGRMPLLLTKNDPQGLGSALTYARRYALSAVLNLVSDVDDDGNAASERQANGTTRAQAPTTTARPAERSEAAPSPAQKGKVNALCNGLSAGEQKAVLSWCCGVSVLDRLPTKGEHSISKLITRLEAVGPQEILAEITTATEAGDERAKTIAARYFEPVAS